MPKHRPKHWLVKKNRNYTVEQAASCLGISRGTVLAWIKLGLPKVEDKRPYLILGSELRDFLKARRIKNKRKCQPGEIYCFKCRAPRTSPEGMIEYKPHTANLGTLIGICQVCQTILYQLTSKSKFERVFRKLDITKTMAQERIVDITNPIVNHHFK